MSVPNEQMIRGYEPPVGALRGRRFKLADGIWTALMFAVALITTVMYYDHMGYYSIIVLFITAGLVSYLGWVWPESKWYFAAVGAGSLISVGLYSTYTEDGAAIGRSALAAAQADSFFLNYMFSSVAASMWMVVLYLLATPTYLIATAIRSDFGLKVGTWLTWAGSVFGFIWFFARWRETYLIDISYGYIPVSNLYEVFVMFAVFTALLYLFFEKRYNNRSLGGFVMLIIAASLIFLMWYQFTRDAHRIEPLIPALQSWWMKIHVPTNFIGYGTFSIAAMIGIAYLIKQKMGGDGPNDRLPSLAVMDDIMYKSIALGFAFFTIATILGAMWAAEAWGGYWSWDPKETWALIVWLNYAAWLHMRLTKGWRGGVMAWWSILGLGITTFAFLGVNMFLSGLHSYGEL